MAEDPFLRQVAECSLELMALAAGQRVLDVGCGTGVLLPALVAAVTLGAAVDAVDHPAALLNEARKRVNGAECGDRVELHEGDARRRPFLEAASDAAHAGRMLMRLAHPDRALGEVLRVVKPGGGGGRGRVCPGRVPQPHDRAGA